MMCCRCLNKNAHPEDAEDCNERCGFCLGYCTPVTIAIIIVGLVISNLVYFALLISRNKTSAWRIVLSIIFILIPIFCGLCVLWAYAIIIFTSPGYVPKDPWVHTPRYVGVGPGPGQTAVTPTNNGILVDAEDTAEAQSHRRLHSGGSAGSRDVANTQREYPTEGPAVTAADKAQPRGHVDGKTFADSGASRPDTEKEKAPIEAVQVSEGPTSATLIHPVRASPRSHSPFDPATNPNPISDTGVMSAPSSRESGGSQAQQRNPYTVKNLDRRNGFRFCNKCQVYKPDLAHHCSACDKCVYNFDHHCPYVNNCVGRNNYKVFLVFVLYGAVGCLLALVCAVLGIFVIDRDPLTTKVGWIAIPAVELILGLALLCFFIQHQCMLSDGQTTLESIITNQEKAKRGWNYWKKPKQTEEEKAAEKIAKKAKIKAHREQMLGDEHPWYRRYLPIPVRTDDTGEDTVKHV